MRYDVDGERLWARLMAMAKIGATPEGGSCRQALSDEDEAGRALFLGWCAARGYQFRRDRIGNLLLRRAGRNPEAGPVLIGSHLDTQPTGGRFDGVLGVLAGLEVLETLDDRAVETDRPIDLCVWTNEEGCRFQPAMMGSGVACGALDLETVFAARDHAGISLASEIVRHGYDREPWPRLADAACYLELHIEQGPILEAEAKTIGVVTGGQGIRWYEISVVGEETHAGPVPMALRKDPVPVLAHVISLVQAIGRSDEAARCTIGKIELSPGAINVVPGRADMTVDLRHPDEAVLDAMHRRFMDGLAALGHGHPEIDLNARPTWHSPVVAFDSRLINTVRDSATDRGLPYRDIVSGAGHDAFNLARRVPTTMIFVPCRQGISHNPREYAAPADVTAGANVLLDVVLVQTRLG
ncbi:MAG TPA: M20 family metallo-hydrolase [Ensifer sp.]|jgi:N-carbamoyl-L-amino-acid hydrolase|uniref:M20 family metallo-hydrolase n=1 Tax=Ensifer sp. TaxID=1872086 RepID=UPI002E11E4F5|nr:M20 family metallo-hydrolase [Ensifer sp.]